LHRPHGERAVGLPVPTGLLLCSNHRETTVSTAGTSTIALGHRCRVWPGVLDVALRWSSHSVRVRPSPPGSTAIVLGSLGLLNLSRSYFRLCPNRARSRGAICSVQREGSG